MSSIASCNKLKIDLKDWDYFFKNDSYAHVKCIVLHVNVRFKHKHSPRKQLLFTKQFKVKNIYKPFD